MDSASSREVAPAVPRSTTEPPAVQRPRRPADATQRDEAVGKATQPGPRPVIAGLTLLELLVVLAVASIVLTVAMPAFQHTVAGGERTAAINTLVTALLLARREAIKRGEAVVLCKTTDGERCERSENTSWAAGHLVFVNVDGDHPPWLDHGEPVLLRGGELTGVSIAANRSAFILRPIPRRSTNGTFTICDRRGAAHARALVVSYTGRARTAEREPDGDPLQCPED
jgi:type IV fimbrial biogenesis protein FimT